MIDICCLIRGFLSATIASGWVSILHLEFHTDFANVEFIYEIIGKKNVIGVNNLSIKRPWNQISKKKYLARFVAIVFHIFNNW